MPKYAWYFINKDDDVCYHVRNISAHSNHLTLFTVLNIFLKLMLISYLTYEMLYS